MQGTLPGPSFLVDPPESTHVLLFPLSVLGRIHAEAVAAFWSAVSLSRVQGKEPSITRQTLAYPFQVSIAKHVKKAIPRILVDSLTHDSHYVVDRFDVVKMIQPPVLATGRPIFLAQSDDFPDLRISCLVLAQPVRQE